jgi:hypothetical protein
MSRPLLVYLLCCEFRSACIDDSANLGRLPFESTFGPLKLETLWAPCALRGIEGEQTLGAVTVNGSLHLTRTSPAPIPALLAGIEEELSGACAA